MKAFILTVLGLSVLPAMMACRGNKSAEPPVHPNLNMDFQQYLKPQEANPWFPDHRAARSLPASTVARVDRQPLFNARKDSPTGFSPKSQDAGFFTGRDANGRLLDGLPDSVPLTDALLERGKARYAIYCVPCPEASGYGPGMIVQRGRKVPPPSFHDPRLQAMPLGYFFDVITHGKNTMKPYGSQVQPDDRWAIAAWLRTLQVSQRATATDIPDAERQKIERGTP